MRQLLLPALFVLLTGCARLTAVQVNDIDQTHSATATITPIHLRLDQNLLNTAAIAQTLNQTGNSSVAAAAAIGYFVARSSSGDAEGRVVLRSEISGDVDWLALQERECPGGVITNLRSINEYDDYLYVQFFNFGFDADCIQPVTAADNTVAPKS